MTPSPVAGAVDCSAAIAPGRDTDRGDDLERAIVSERGSLWGTARRTSIDALDVRICSPGYAATVVRFALAGPAPPR